MDWNWTKEAQERYITAHEHGYTHDAQLAIAAALIDLAEQRPKFVQVGEHRINLTHIIQIEDFGDGINVWLSDGPAAQLYGKHKAAFLLWHEQHADIVRLGTETNTESGICPNCGRDYRGFHQWDDLDKCPICGASVK